MLSFSIRCSKAELRAVLQYLLHAAICKNWGYERLHEQFSHLANEEISHSSGLIDHILYRGGTPDVEHLDQVGAGRMAADLLKEDFGIEREEVELLRKAISHYAKVVDFTIRHMLEGMIEDSEEHADWFETQLRTAGRDRELFG